MSLKTIKIFIGCDPNNCDLEQMMVLDYSIKKHTQQPVEIIWMQLSRDPSSYWYSDPKSNQGWRTENWATPFSGFRWAIPEYCQFQGKAFYMDTDVIVLDDLALLWEHPIEANAIVAAKGGGSSARLCTCVWDCEKAKHFLPRIEELKSNPASHQSLMRQIQKEPSLVQAYNDHFNCIDGENLSINEIKILHYSDMGTQFSHKYSIPRLQHNNSTHWFDGEIIPHPRADLTTLFDQYYHEALSAGYQLEDYTITPYGKFHKASQKKYSGNNITRSETSQPWFKRLLSKFKTKRDSFNLDH